MFADARHRRTKTTALLAVVFLIILTGFLAVGSDEIVQAPLPTQTAPILFVATEYDPETRGALTAVDLESGNMTKLPLHAEGCDGVGLPPNGRLAMVSCRFGETPYASYNLATGTLTPMFAGIPEIFTFRSPLACAGEGRCYYGFGHVQPAIGSPGRIMVAERERIIETHKLPQSDRPYIPTRLVVDHDTLFVLARDEDMRPSMVYRFDTKSGRWIEPAFTLQGEAWGMAVRDGLLAVSLLRPMVGHDVVVLDSTTGDEIGRITARGDWPARNVFDVEILDRAIFTAGVGGVSKFESNSDGEWFEVFNATTSDFALELAHLEGKVYATIPNADEVVEYDGRNLSWLRSFTLPIDFGEINVVGKRD